LSNLQETPSVHESVFRPLGERCVAAFVGSAFSKHYRKVLIARSFFAVIVWNSFVVLSSFLAVTLREVTYV
jgi:hypothetical protein